MTHVPQYDYTYPDYYPRPLTLGGWVKLVYSEWDEYRAIMEWIRMVRKNYN